MTGSGNALLWQTEPARLSGTATARVTAKLLYEMVESQRFRCALTGRELTPDTASLDHKLPMSRGGQNTIDNAQIVDWDVNRCKGTMTTEEFIALCREVVAMADGSR